MTAGRYVLREGGRTHDVGIATDGLVSAAGRSWTVEPGAGGRWLLSDAERQVLAYAVTDGDVTWVHVAGEVYVFEVAPAGSARTRPRVRHGGDLSAPMPAVVRSVPVSAGDQVAAGDVLVMLEAMKMELPIRAPRAGVVRSVGCTPGDLVQPGVALVELA
jgi:biotin carboxyl carrier protein